MDTLLKMLSVERLCLECGFCCNGVLFADVRIQAGDDVERLLSLGVPFKKRGRDYRLSQPCACLEGTRCRIYEARPVRCRQFDCRILQRVQDGEIEFAGAQKIIRKAVRQVGAIEKLLQQMGQAEKHLPLNKRCKRAMARPIDLATEEWETDLRGKLLLAVDKLGKILQTDFC